MGFVRAAVFVSIVAIGGAAYIYRDDVIRQVGPHIGMGTAAKTADAQQASPAAGAQPQGRRGRANPGGAVPVVVMPVTREAMPVVVDAVGTVQSIASVQIKPRMDSQIMKVNVEEGALVKEGDILFELDARSLKAQLGQIEAQIRKDQAQVAPGLHDLQRNEELLAKNAGTVVQRDNAGTALKAAEAQLEADEANKGQRPDPSHVHRDPGPGFGAHRLDREQGGGRRPHRRQFGHQHAGHDQPDRPDLCHLRHPADHPA